MPRYSLGLLRTGVSARYYRGLELTGVGFVKFSTIRLPTYAGLYITVWNLERSYNIDILFLVTH